MDKLVYAAVEERAAGKCECGCGEYISVGELDHFFGKAKAEETVETCWMLKPEHHRAKTDNKPDGPTWLRKFIYHATSYGYAKACVLASEKLAWLESKKEIWK